MVNFKETIVNECLEVLGREDVKDEIKELTKEEDIKNKKYKTTKVYLRDMNTHSSHEEEHHQAQCVHQ